MSASFALFPTFNVPLLISTPPVLALFPSKVNIPTPSLTKTSPPKLLRKEPVHPYNQLHLYQRILGWYFFIATL